VQEISGKGAEESFEFRSGVWGGSPTSPAAGPSSSTWRRVPLMASCSASKATTWSSPTASTAC